MDNAEKMDDWYKKESQVPDKKFTEYDAQQLDRTDALKDEISFDSREAYKQALREAIENDEYLVNKEYFLNKIDTVTPK